MPDEQSPVELQFGEAPQTPSEPTAEEKNHLSRHQKIGLLLLSVFALLAVGLGYMQIRNTMLAPFALNNKIPPLDEAQTNNIEALRLRDTDKEGINDFDELYVYQTSPYLADTDSDGISDKEEINKGANPNCPEGKTCTELGFSGESMPTATSGAANILGGTVTAPVGESPLDIGAALSDPAQLRQLLLSSGMDKTILDKISDADLLQAVREIMSSSTSQSSQMISQ